VDQEEQARRPIQELGFGTFAPRAAGPSQRGWVGLIVILIALVIAAMLAQTVLKSYGLLPGPESANSAGTRLPPTVSPAPIDATSAPATPANALERARGLEQQVQRDAQDRAERIDESTK
jgi:hypothetical protein